MQGKEPRVQDGVPVQYLFCVGVLVRRYVIVSAVVC